MMKSYSMMQFVTFWLLTSAASGQAIDVGLQKNLAVGPLRVHPNNPRYFTDGTQHPNGSSRAIYLTGSHTWSNLQDNGLGVEAPLSITDPPDAFDYTAYLDLLQSNHHNFIRLWRWELPRAHHSKSGDYYSEPHPWVRSGPGMALDGKLKFDVNNFAQSYFERLRSRVVAARGRGIYVSIMLFEGWYLRGSPDSWQFHPFHRSNNVNHIDGDLNGNGGGEETNSLQVSTVFDLQKAYVRKVIDTVNDLDNVLYEIANESAVTGSEQWQYELINYVKTYQATKPKQHPVGMTQQAWGTKNDSLWNSSADWTSQGQVTSFDNAEDPFVSDPPLATGGKVSILDTDHLGWKIFVDDAELSRAWVWKSFLRGHNTILMEDLQNNSGWLAARAAMGHTRRYANKMNLAKMVPSVDIASTKYCLAFPGQEYLVYQPATGEFSVNLLAGNYVIEWFNPTTGSLAVTGSLAATGGDHHFSPPFPGPAVLSIQVANAAGVGQALVKPIALGLASRFTGDSGVERHPAVLFADNFETGDIKKWDERRGRIVLSEDQANTGRWCVHMPMERGKNTGADAKKWFMPGADKVYARFYVKFSADYQYNHHFVGLLANQRNNKWSAFGKAGNKPDGTYYSTAMEPWFAWGKNPPPGEVNLYSYFLDMQADTKMNKYWGNAFFPKGPDKGIAASADRVVPPLDQWQCWEFMIQANSAPDKADGQQAMWVDGKLVGEFTGIRWRSDLDLKVNCLWLEHYGYDAGDPTKQYWNDSQSVWFDDVVVATEYIGPINR